MPELPQRRVGIVSCPGEDLAEWKVTRLAALKVLEELRPGDTVTVCLPLFLAGGEDIEVVQVRTRRALQAAQKYSLVANSVKSEIIIEPKIEIVE